MNAAQDGKKPRQTYYVAPEGAEVPATVKTKDEIAANLKRLCLDRGWSQSDLARMASKFMPSGKEVSRQTISHLMTGRHAPSQEVLVAISAALNVSPLEIYPAPDVTWVGAAAKAYTEQANRDIEKPLTKERILFSINGDKARLQLDVELPVDKALKIMALVKDAAA